jgi:hypothetical protein
VTVDIANLDAEVIAFHTALTDRLMTTHNLTELEAKRYVMGAASYAVHILHSHLQREQRVDNAKRQQSNFINTHRDPLSPGPSR